MKGYLASVSIRASGTLMIHGWSRYRDTRRSSSSSGMAVAPPSTRPARTISRYTRMRRIRRCVDGVTPREYAGDFVLERREFPIEVPPAQEVLWFSDAHAVETANIICRAVRHAPHAIAACREGPVFWN